MSWHYLPDAGIHTRHPTPNLPGTFTPNDALNLDPTQERRSIAAHEAGHAAAYLAHGIKFIDITIGGLGPDENGITPAARVRPLPTFRATDEQVLQVLAAGERAQDRWLREQGLWTPTRAWAVEVTAGHDRGEMKRHGLDYDTSDLTSLHAETDALLDRLWPSVIRLGDALDRHGHLTYEQAVEAAAVPCGR
jgi:hypothetical protein